MSTRENLTRAIDLYALFNDDSFCVQMTEAIEDALDKAEARGRAEAFEEAAKVCDELAENLAYERAIGAYDCSRAIRGRAKESGK